MISICKFTSCVSLLLLVAVNPLFAETLEKPLSIEKRLADEKPLPTIRQGGAHGSKSPHSRLSPEMHVQVALQHKAEGRMGEAFRTLDLAIQRNPMSTELFAVRGSFYLERQNVSAALQDFESALNISPDSAAILTNRAQAYRHFGRINEALNDLNKAIELNPDLLAAYFNRGAIHYSSSDYELALKDFDSCIAIDPHAAGPYFNRASARDALGDRTGAIEDIKRFIEIAGNSSWKNTAQQLLQKWEPADPSNKLEESKS
jgi:tetratricopeptide (TPR) repeat protein